jgi:hypothetical protein
MPGCDTEGCENGMYPPCVPVVEYEGSAVVNGIKWPEVAVSDLIE